MTNTWKMCTCSFFFCHSWLSYWSHIIQVSENTTFGCFPMQHHIHLLKKAPGYILNHEIATHSPAPSKKITLKIWASKSKWRQCCPLEKEGTALAQLSPDWHQISRDPKLILRSSLSSQNYCLPQVTAAPVWLKHSQLSSSCRKGQILGSFGEQR
jgi:hypothetical protein